MNRICTVIPATVLFLAACEETHEPDYIHTSDLPQIPLEHVANFPGGDDELILDRIREVQLDSLSRVFVVDGGRPAVFVFEKGSGLLQQVGREGAGPGEFETIVDMFISPAEQLFVYDVSTNRTSEFVETNGHWSLEDIYEPEAARQWIFQTDGEYDAIFRAGGVNPPEEDGPHWYINEISAGNLEMEMRDEKLELKDQPSLVYQNRFLGLPTLRADAYARGRDGSLYMMWNDRFEVAKYNTRLELVDSVSASVPNQPYPEEERDEFLNSLEGGQRSLARDHLDETLPVINWDFLLGRGWEVDQEGNHWLRTYDEPEYLVLDPDGNPIGSFDLPEDFLLQAVNNDHIIAQGYSEDGDYQIRMWSYN